jgi:hypothetical protein
LHELLLRNEHEKQIHSLPAIVNHHKSIENKALSNNPSRKYTKIQIKMRKIDNSVVVIDEISQIILNRKRDLIQVRNS